MRRGTPGRRRSRSSSPASRPGSSSSARSNGSFSKPRANSCACAEYARSTGSRTSTTSCTPAGRRRSAPPPAGGTCSTGWTRRSSAAAPVAGCDPAARWPAAGSARDTRPARAGSRCRSSARPCAAPPSAPPGARRAPGTATSCRSAGAPTIRNDGVIRAGRGQPPGRTGPSRDQLLQPRRSVTAALSTVSASTSRSSSISARRHRGSSQRAEHAQPGAGLGLPVGAGSGRQDSTR